MTQSTKSNSQIVNLSGTKIKIKIKKISVTVLTLKFSGKETMAKGQKLKTKANSILR
jgi:hypothetical protein